HRVANLGRPVRAFRVVLDPQAAPQPRAEAKKPVAASERPSVAVLPLQNLGGDAETEFFLDSVAADLITELARARWFAMTERKPAVSPAPYELTLRAMMPALAEAPEENDAALHLLDEALALDRRHPMANALAAWCHLQRHLLDWPAAQPNDRENAKRLARIAIE